MIFWKPKQCLVNNKTINKNKRSLITSHHTRIINFYDLGVEDAAGMPEINGLSKTHRSIYIVILIEQ